MATLTWLHLSDWHQRGKDFNRQVVRDQLVKDIRDRVSIDPRLAKIDFIVVSGDIAFSGRREEYEAARNNWLEPIREATGLEADKIWFVPGNHDLDRGVFELLPAAILKPFKTEEEVQEWLTEDAKRDRLLEPFKQYREFVSAYTGRDEQPYANVMTLNRGGRKVALIGLNSALMCARQRDSAQQIDDRAALIVGEPQVYEALTKAEGADLVIAVIHHPFDWLSWTEGLAEKNLIRGRLKRDCHFVLRGHEHEPNVDVESGTFGDCIVISAGASYDRREPVASRYANGYNYVHLDLEAGGGTIFLRRYEDRQGWIKDTGTTGDVTPGYFKFELPKGPDKLRAPTETMQASLGGNTALRGQSAVRGIQSAVSGVLSADALKQAIEDERFLIDPEPAPEQYGSASLILRLGPEFRRWGTPPAGVDIVLDPAKQSFVETAGRLLEDVPRDADGSIVLAPGAFVLAVTSETVGFPIDGLLSGRIDGRSTLSRLGVSVSPASGCVETGFRGRITLEILNLGSLSVRLRPGMPICRLEVRTVASP